MRDQLKYFDGELESIEGIPDDIRVKYKTAFAIEYKYFIDAAARRQEMDRSGSVGESFLPSPDIKTLSHMYRDAWHKGLKTTYLRTLGASNIEKATVSVKKEVRGRAGAAGEGSAASKKEYSPEEVKTCSLEAMMRGEECEACQ